MPAPLNILFITADQWRGDCLSAVGHPMVKGRRISMPWPPRVCCSSATSPTQRRADPVARRCTPACTCRTTARARTARRSTRATPTGRSKPRSSATIRCCSATPTPAAIRAASPRTARGCAPTRVHFPGFARSCISTAIRPPGPTGCGARATKTPDNPRGRLRPARASGAGVRRRRASELARSLFPAEVDDVAFLTGELIDYLKGATGPFIAHLSLLRPHPPFVAPTPYNALYDPAAVPPFRRAESAETEGRQHPLARLASRPPAIPGD